MKKALDDLVENYISQSAEEKAVEDFCEILLGGFDKKELRKRYKKLKKRYKDVNYIIGYLFLYLVEKGEIKITLDFFGMEDGSKPLRAKAALDCTELNHMVFFLDGRSKINGYISAEIVDEKNLRR